MTIAVALDGKLGNFALNIAFDVPSTGVTALLGPSGSGKTTILRALAGLNRIPGTIVVDGEIWQNLPSITPSPQRGEGCGEGERGRRPSVSALDVGHPHPTLSLRERAFWPLSSQLDADRRRPGATRGFLAPERRRVGYVFQGAGLLPHLSVAANLDYAARRAPAGPFSRADVIDRAGIGHLLDRLPSRLSGGEAQRASIARALLNQPRLLLMDEPLSALDSDARADLLGWLEALLAGIGIPAFYVTHDHAEAARLASRTLRLTNGRLAA